MQTAPSVLYPDETWQLPDRMYVAARPHRATGGPMFEVREHGKHAQQVILAFSSLDGFLDGCGADQPWMLIPSQRLQALGECAGGKGFAYAVALDRPVPDEARGTAGGFALTEAAWDDEQSEDWDAVHIPSRPFRPGAEQAQLELQPLNSGHLAMVTFSSRASLEAGCGLQQAWVTVPAGLLAEARRQSGADTICLDMPLPENVRHGSEGSQP